MEVQTEEELFIWSLLQNCGQHAMLNIHQGILRVATCVPIGCSTEYAFVLIKAQGKRRAWLLRALDLTRALHAYDTPFRASGENRTYNNPWQTWPQKIEEVVLATACFLSHVFLVLQRSIVVLDAAKDWEFSATISGDISYTNVYACDANLILIACLSKEPESGKCALNVLSFHTNTWSRQELGMCVPNAVEVGKDRTPEMGTSIMISAGSTTMRFRYNLVTNQLDVENKLQLWPNAADTKLPLIRESATVIRHRNDRVFQAYRRDYVYFCSALPKPLHGSVPHDIVSALSVGNSYFLVHDITNGLHICSTTTGVLHTITGQCISSYADIASGKQIRASLPYASMQMSDSRIALLLPCGDLVFLHLNRDHL